MDELLTAIETDYAHPEVALESIEWNGPASVSLVISIAPFVTARPRERWTIECEGVLESRVGKDRSGEEIQMVREADHPVNRQFTDPAAMLYYRGAPASPTALVGELWAAHDVICGDWIEFRDYVGDEPPLHERLATPFGRLADGPRFLLERYAAILAAHGVTADLRVDAPSKIERVETIAIGRSHIVARRFRARRGP